MEPAELEKSVNAFPVLYRSAFDRQLVARLGLEPKDEGSDRRLAETFWRFLAASALPFEQAFFDWFGGLEAEERAARSPHAAVYAGTDFAAVREAMAGYATGGHARLDHPYFAGAEPCTMLIDEVERIWAFIDEGDDWSAFREKLAAIGGMREAYGLAG